MMIILKRISVAVILLAGLQSANAISTDDKNALDFFTQYQKLNQSYDPQLAQLYSDEAKISVTILDDDMETIRKIKGSKFKSMMAEAMNYARAVNSTDRYTDVRVKALTHDQFQIQAQRYSFDKCYNDQNFSLTLQKDKNRGFLITEENSNTLLKSRCTQSLKEDIPAKLQAIATLQSKQLPLRMDREIQIEKIYADGMTLHYELRMLDYRGAEIDQAKLQMNLEPIMVNNACRNTNIRQELDSGVVVNQRLYSKDNQQILNVKIDKNSCVH